MNTSRASTIQSSFPRFTTSARAFHRKIMHVLLPALALLTTAGAIRAQQVADRAVVNGRMMLGGSIKEVAAGTLAAGTSQAVLVRDTLTAEEMGSQIIFEVGIKMRDLDQLQTRLAAGETITPAELKSRYLPLASDCDAVENWLVSQGFTSKKRDSHDLAIFASGTVAQVQQAFQTRFAQVAFEGTNHLAAVTAPSVPASLTAVLGVTGLQPFYHFHTHFHNQFAVPATGNKPPYLVSEILGAFDAVGTGLTGAGEEIAIIIDAVPNGDDLTLFWQDNSIGRSLDDKNVSYAYAGVSGTQDSVSGEETLDVEWSSAIAPKAAVLIVDSGTLAFTDTDSAYSELGSALGNKDFPDIHQVSMSYGAYEDEVSDAEIQMEEQYFATIASYGVTIFASTGDNGAFDNMGNLSVEYPSSDPNITGVGGVSIVLDPDSGAVTSETAWTADAAGFSDGRIAASTGGFSRLPRPAWQKGTGVPAGSTRCLPDVAASADQDEPGFLVVTVNGTQYVGGYANGTSWASPTWVGLCALLNQARATAGMGTIGLLNPKIYPLIGTSSFRDITVGSNGHHGETDGYSCTPGYDLVTGIGSPYFANLVGALTGAAPTISSFSPASGAVGAAVVIKGTNFVAPLSVVFAGNKVAVHGFTATQISAQVPAGAITGPIRVTTGGGSVLTASDFIVKAPPTITSFTPTSGVAGSTVAIRGTNFAAPLSVIFGGNAVAVHGVTATQINATVPGGAITGPIKVTTSYGSVSTASSFTVEAGAPTISSFSPSSGLTGSTVVIKGTNFVAPLSVIFGGNAVAVHGFTSTQINATVPAGAVTGPIKITTSHGSVSTNSNFAVTSPPTISSFSPSSGGIGNTVIIQGTGFQAPLSVIFGGDKAAVHSFTATQISARVPSGAVTGPIKVYTAYGSSSTFTFTVIPSKE